VKLNFLIPKSVWQDFQAYGLRYAGSNFPAWRSWMDAPILNSLRIGIPDKGAMGWDTHISRPRNGLSLAGRVKRIRQLAKREPLIAVTEEIAWAFWEKIQTRAAFYGITAGELCVSCLAYHAGLERKGREAAEKNRMMKGSLGG
jgi:hypothetical protein